MANKHTWAAGLFTTGSVVAVTAVVAAATQHPGAWTAPWFVVLTCLAFGLVAGAAILLASAKFSEPHLVFGEPFRAERPVGTFRAAFGTSTAFGASTPGSVPGVTGSFGGTGAIGYQGPTDPLSRFSPVGDATFVYVPVYNKKRPGRQAAEQVWATVSFVRQSGDTFSMPARWSDPPESQLRQPTMRAPEVSSIPANGNAHMLDVALKYLEDDRCYAFNDENRLRELDLRYRELADHATTVRVEVSSNTVSLIGEFNLTHGGVDTEPVLEYKGTYTRRTFSHLLKGAYRQKLYSP